MTASSEAVWVVRLTIRGQKYPPLSNSGSSRILVKLRKVARELPDLPRHKNRETDTSLQQTFGQHWLYSKGWSKTALNWIIYSFIGKWSYRKDKLIGSSERLSDTRKITVEGTKLYNIVGYNILMPMTMKIIIIIWDMMPCSLVEVYLCFEGTYSSHL
jgi:hypothetical protein